MERFSSCEVSSDEEWISFMSSYYELPCRENLFAVSHLSCLCRFNFLSVGPAFAFILTDLASDRVDFILAVRSEETSLARILNVFELFSNLRNVAPIFVLLSNSKNLLEDQQYLSAWNSPECVSRR